MGEIEKKGVLKSSFYNDVWQYQSPKWNNNADRSSKSNSQQNREFNANL